MIASHSLRDLQRSLALFITRAHEVEGPWPAESASPHLSLFDHVGADRGVPTGDRLWICEHAQFARIHDVRREDFCALQAAVGDDAFHDLAKLYALAHPSHSFSLRFAEARFPDFLAGPVVAPLIARWPFAADLAAFEWMRVDLFDAPDDRPLQRAALAAVPPERWSLLRFDAVRASQLGRYDWPARLLYEAWSADRDLPAIAPAATVVLFHRRRERVVQRVFSPLEEEALGLLCGGADFESICRSTSRALGEVEGPRYVLGLLERWIADELLVEFVDPTAVG